jgi:hypothetical protein
VEMVAVGRNHCSPTPVRPPSARQPAPPPPPPVASVAVPTQPSRRVVSGGIFPPNGAEGRFPGWVGSTSGFRAGNQS